MNVTQLYNCDSGSETEVEDSPVLVSNEDLLSIPTRPLTQNCNEATAASAISNINSMLPLDMTPLYGMDSIKHSQSSMLQILPEASDRPPAATTSCPTTDSTTSESSATTAKEAVSLIAKLPQWQSRASLSAAFSVQEVRKLLRYAEVKCLISAPKEILISELLQALHQGKFNSLTSTQAEEMSNAEVNRPETPKAVTAAEMMMSGWNDMGSPLVPAALLALHPAATKRLAAPAQMTTPTPRSILSQVTTHVAAPVPVTVPTLSGTPTATDIAMTSAAPKSHKKTNSGSSTANTSRKEGSASSAQGGSKQSKARQVTTTVPPIQPVPALDPTHAVIPPPAIAPCPTPMALPGWVVRYRQQEYVRHTGVLSSLEQIRNRRQGEIGSRSASVLCHGGDFDRQMYPDHKRRRADSVTDSSSMNVSTGESEFYICPSVIQQATEGIATRCDDLLQMELNQTVYSHRCAGTGVDGVSIFNSTNMRNANSHRLFEQALNAYYQQRTKSTSGVSTGNNADVGRRVGTQLALPLRATRRIVPFVSIPVGARRQSFNHNSKLRLKHVDGGSDTVQTEEATADSTNSSYANSEGVKTSLHALRARILHHHFMMRPDAFGPNFPSSAAYTRYPALKLVTFPAARLGISLQEVRRADGTVGIMIKSKQQLAELQRNAFSNSNFSNGTSCYRNDPGSSLHDGTSSGDTDRALRERDTYSRINKLLAVGDELVTVNNMDLPALFDNYCGHPSEHVYGALHAHASGQQRIARAGELLPVVIETLKALPRPLTIGFQGL